MPLSIQELLDRSRKELLDLSTRNRLLSIPPPEFRAAILSVLEASHGATRSEIPKAVARLFGFQATSLQLRALIETQVEQLIRAGKAAEANGMLKLPAA